MKCAFEDPDTHYPSLNSLPFSLTHSIPSRQENPRNSPRLPPMEATTVPRSKRSISSTEVKSVVRYHRDTMDKLVPRRLERSLILPKNWGLPF